MWPQIKLLCNQTSYCFAATRRNMTSSPPVAPTKMYFLDILRRDNVFCFSISKWGHIQGRHGNRRKRLAVINTRVIQHRVEFMRIRNGSLGGSWGFFFYSQDRRCLSANDSRVRFCRDAVSPVERNGRVGLRRAVELHKMTLKNRLGLHGEIDEREVYK